MMDNGQGILRTMEWRTEFFENRLTLDSAKVKMKNEADKNKGMVGELNLTCSPQGYFAIIVREIVENFLTFVEAVVSMLKQKQNQRWKTIKTLNIFLSGIDAKQGEYIRRLKQILLQLRGTKLGQLSLNITRVNKCSQIDLKETLSLARDLSLCFFKIEFGLNWWSFVEGQLPNFRELEQILKSTLIGGLSYQVFHLQLAGWYDQTQKAEYFLKGILSEQELSRLILFSSLGLNAQNSNANKYNKVNEQDFKTKQAKVYNEFSHLIRLLEGKQEDKRTLKIFSSQNAALKTQAFAILSLIKDLEYEIDNTKLDQRSFKDQLMKRSQQLEMKNREMESKKNEQRAVKNKIREREESIRSLEDSLANKVPYVAETIWNAKVDFFHSKVIKLMQAFIKSTKGLNQLELGLEDYVSSLRMKDLKVKLNRQAFEKEGIEGLSKVLSKQFRKTNTDQSQQPTGPLFRTIYKV